MKAAMTYETTNAHASINPFAAFLNPMVSVEAHVRMASQVLQSVIHRPLDKPQIPTLGAKEAVDDDVGAETEAEEVYEVVAAGPDDMSDIVTNFDSLN